MPSNLLFRGDSNILVTHFRTALVPMVPGTTILGNFVNILILGKNLSLFFLKLAQVLAFKPLHVTISACNPGYQYSGRTVFHLSLVICTGLVKGQKCDGLAYDAKYPSYK